MYLSRAAMSLYSLPGLPECSNSICTSPQSWAEAFTTPFSDEKAEACRAGHATGYTVRQMPLPRGEGSPAGQGSHPFPQIPGPGASTARGGCQSVFAL